MLPLITAALGLVQQNQQDKAARKQAMSDAAMGQFAESKPPGGKANAMIGLGEAIGGMLGPSTAPSAIGPNGGQPLSADANKDLDSALGAIDQKHKGTTDDMNLLPMRGNWY